MRKLKSIRRSVGFPREKGMGASQRTEARRADDQRSQQRVWSLLLPPAYFSERR